MWAHLDLSLAAKSAAVKATVQARCTRRLQEDGSALDRALCAWLVEARVVAEGMHALFEAGMLGWDVGLDPETHEALIDPATGCATHPRDAWFPFERYDRTAVDARYVGCFGNAEAHRMRSRVAFDKCGPGTVTEAQRARWQRAVQAHRRMLDVEAKGGLFDERTPELGGLFLLTHTPDNWAKRPGLFDADFWMLRAVHFGLERNLGLRINRFSLEAGDGGGGRALRQSCPDPVRSYCWLDNALHTIVALKVVVFLRVRWHAYDRAEGRPQTTEAALAELVLADRHDVEQSKSHWLPPGRQSSSGSGSGSPGTSPPGPQPRPSLVPSAASADADAESLVERLVQWLVARRAERGCAPLREKARHDGHGRFLLLQRIDALDRMVGLHLAHKRAVAEATRQIERDAEAEVEALTAERSRLTGPANKRRLEALDVRMEEVTRRCQLGAIVEAARERVRSNAAGAGLRR